MRSFRNSRFPGWMAMGVVTAFLGTQFVCVAQQRDDRPLTVNAANNSSKAEEIATLFKASGFTLAKAIKAAEDHCKGVALAATGHCTDAQSQKNAVVDVTVLDSNRAVRLVTVDMNGKVVGMRDGTLATTAGSGYSTGSPGSSSIVKAEDVIGRQVIGANGDDLGKIEDLAIDPSSGRVGYAVLSFGGWLGINDKLFAIPWPKLQPKGADKYVLDVSKEQLKSAPGFSKNTWPDMNDLKWNETIHTFYQQPYYWNDNRDNTSSSGDNSRRPSVYKGSDVLGMNVINVQKETIGEIEDLVIDPQSGMIRYAVVSVGGFLGINERYVAVPWSAFNYDSNAKKLVLDVDKKRIEQAPGFDKQHWPTFTDEEWATNLHRYYNVPPYWETRPSGNAPRTDQP